MFDTILEEPAILARAESVTKKYDEFIDIGRRKLMGHKIDDYDL